MRWNSNQGNGPAHPGSGNYTTAGDASPDATYQVVNVDDFSDCVWLRRFPLRERRLPTFSVPADQVRPIASELS
ncbi:hypothetical protein LBMAG41_32330 [Cyanobium sp.]|nr:hypothetical protein LBMAG41_32330 [Cyanobium sp.]